MPPHPVTAVFAAVAVVLVLTGCAGAPVPRAGESQPASPGAGAPHGGAPEIVLAALNFLDRPYARGGDGAAHPTQGGFDCSGFTRHVYAVAAGWALPRTAHEQAHAPGLVGVERDALQPGDLVFFNTLRRRFSHVGVYIGGGRFIHAPRVGAQVRVESLRVDYWARRFDGARRAPSADDRFVRTALPAGPADDRP
ncbi:MAG: C40 family peptidase [Gammaproteobacteria bacterium]